MMVMFTSRRAWLGLLLCTGIGCSGGIESTDNGTGPAAPSGTAPGVPPATTVNPGSQLPTQQPPASVAGSAAPAMPPNTNTGVVPPGSAPAMDPMMPAGMIPPATTAPAGAITYNKDIKPIMVANCSMACHGPDPATRAG